MFNKHFMFIRNSPPLWIQSLCPQSPFDVVTLDKNTNNYTEVRKVWQVQAWWKFEEPWKLADLKQEPAVWGT